jgi:hypothetical protein
VSVFFLFFILETCQFCLWKKKKHFQAFLQNSHSVENFACFHGMEAPQTPFKKKLVCIIQGGF